MVCKSVSKFLLKKQFHLFTVQLRVLTRVTNQESNTLTKRHSTKGSKISSISNLKKPACASKRDVLELAKPQENMNATPERNSVYCDDITFKLQLIEQRMSSEKEASLLSCKTKKPALCNYLWLYVLNIVLLSKLTRPMINFVDIAMYFALISNQITQ